MKLDEYEIIDGKPFGGLWFGTYLRSFDILVDDISDPIFSVMKEKIEEYEKNTLKEFQHRNVQFISKFPFYNEPLLAYTFGVKFLAWGRAFKIFKTLRTGKKQFKKKYICGRRKLVGNR